MLRSSPIMKIMKSVILSFLENSGFFRRSKVSTRASRTRRWQISSPPVFPYPFEFPSRNKKENAAEIIFVSKESAFLLHFPRVLTHNRKKRRTDRRRLEPRLVRVLIERTKRSSSSSDCLTTRAMGGETYLVGFQFVLSIRRLASRANVSRLLHCSQPGLSSLLPAVA